MTTEEKLELCLKALNRIGILQMGELDYTKDFFEMTKEIVRDTLGKIYGRRDTDCI